MTKKTHQHFIPRTYLKRFAHRIDGDVYFVDALDKNTFEIKEDMAISNLCVDCDLYTLKKLDSHDKYKIEDFFNNEIENDYDEVYNILTNDTIEIIGLDQRIKILKTLLSMYFRTPKALNEFVNSSIDFLKDLKTKDTGKFKFMGIEIDLSNQNLKDIKREIRENKREDFIKTNLLVLNEFIKLRAFDGIIVIKLIGDQEFITSDNPVSISNINGQLLDLFSLNNSISVPINPKYCVFIAPPTEEAIVNKIYRNQDNFIHHIIENYSTFQDAERWCIGSKSGIVKFKTEYEVYTQPVDDDHPIVKQAIENANIMTKLADLLEKGNTLKDYSELSRFIKEAEKKDSFSSNVSFIAVVKQLRDKKII